MILSGFLISCTSKRASFSTEVGKVVHRIKPGEDNLRNSEGDFLELNDGRILFIYSHYTGDSGADHAQDYLAAIYSSDGGKTWASEDEVIFLKKEI